MKKPKPKSVILSSDPNLGDVIVTLPMAGLIKEQYPDCQVILLAKNYVKALVPSCRDINGFISLDELLGADEETAVNLLKASKANWIIHIYTNKKIASLAKKAGISERVGTSNRWYHFTNCTRILWTSRRSSVKHEAQINVQMLTPLKIKAKHSGEQLIPYIRISPQTPAPESVLEKLDPDRFNLVIHPGTSGQAHSREWPITYFQELINLLPSEQFNIILTGVAKEFARFRETLIEPFPHIHNVMGKTTLAELAGFLSVCDGILVGGTGPAHLSAALGIRTLGLYPALVPIRPTRWRPLGVKAQYLVASEICSFCASTSELVNNGPGCTCMTGLQVSAVKNVLTAWQKQKAVEGI